MRIEKNGNEYDFKLDIPAIMDMEAKDPEFSIINVMEKFADRPRFTELYTMAKAVGWDYSEFIAAGFNIQDLMNVLPECIREVGFFIATEQEPAQQSADA